MRDFDRLLSLVCGISFQPAQFMWLYHLFLFGLRRLLCDLRPDISIASISTAVHAPRKLEGGGPNLRHQLLFGTCLSTVRCFLEVDSFSLIFYQLLLSLNRSLKLIWIVYVIRNFSLTLQRLWCTQLQLDSNTFVFPKQDMQWTRKIFSASRLRQTLCFFFLERRETGRLPGENYMFVCAIILLFENRFIFPVCLTQPCKLTCSEQRFGWLEVFNDQIESLPLAQGVSCLCKFEL